MKHFISIAILFLLSQHRGLGQANLPDGTVKPFSEQEKTVLAISATKWDWMSDKKVDSLAGLFDERSVFVHMGGSWGKNQELNTIKGGMIWYKKADVYSASVNLFGNTAIVLNDIDLLAVVGGNEVVHAFMVTEVYLKKENKWQLGSLTFSSLLRPVKMNTKK